MPIPAIAGQIAVLSASHAIYDDVQLANSLALPLVSAVTADFDYYLHYSEQGLALSTTSASMKNPLVLDLLGGKAAHRRQFGGGELLLKAIAAPRRQQVISVLDATAGFGSDSGVLVNAGFSVLALERQGWVFAMLQDALQRALAAEPQGPWQNLLLLHADARTMLTAADRQYDVVYLDPMFPHSGKSARVKKGMSALQSLVGYDQDADHLWQLAMQSARHRVVVKRALKAPYLAEQKPVHSYRGKAIRFDVYTNKAWAKA